jgi:hypothetical protein
MSLKERVHEVEGDSEEAFRARRQLLRLLVDGIVIEDKRKGEEPRVRITYRFDPPEGASREQDGDLCQVSRNSTNSLKPRPRPAVRRLSSGSRNAALKVRSAFVDKRLGDLSV